MNNDITPERLMKLAAVLGKQHPKIDVQNRVWIKVPTKTTLYQPHKDWNQCGEVLEYFKSIHEFRCLIFMASDLLFENNDLNLKEAFVLVALEFIESKE